MPERENFNPEAEKLKEFAELRERINKEIEIETGERVKKNPIPSEEELLAGAFREMIEPQVRDAVFDLYRKGYATESSGFGGEYGEIQQIDGYFEIDEETKKEITALGASVKTDEEAGYFSKEYTFISFKPARPDLNEIKAQWEAIIRLLPAKRQPAEPSISGASEDFRKRYAPDRTDIEAASIERYLKLEEIEPSTRKQLQARLKKLRK